MTAFGTTISAASLRAMPPARRRIFEAGLRANIRDPEVGVRPGWGEFERQQLAEQRRYAEAVERRRLAEAAERAARALAAREAEADPLGDVRQARPVLAQVAARHGTTIGIITGRSRIAEAIVARQEVMYRLYVELGLTFVAIGRRLNRDQSTVRHGVRAHAERNGLPVPDGLDGGVVS